MYASTSQIAVLCKININAGSYKIGSEDTERNNGLNAEMKKKVLTKL